MVFLSVSNNFYRSSLFFSFGLVDKIVIDTILYYILLFYVACSDTKNHTETLPG